jgi:uncharacterized membrane protein (GlpM family)
MRNETYYSGIILFIATFVLVIGIFVITEPETMRDKKTRKLVKWKIILYTSIISLVFALSVSYFSEKIDSISEKSK